MCAGRRQRRIGHRRCCSDVVHGRRVAPRTAGVSVGKQQPADNRQQDTPAPGPTEREMQYLLAYTGSVAVVRCNIKTKRDLSFLWLILRGRSKRLYRCVCPSVRLSVCRTPVVVPTRERHAGLICFFLPSLRRRPLMASRILCK